MPWAISAIAALLSELPQRTIPGDRRNPPRLESKTVEMTDPGQRVVYQFVTLEGENGGPLDWAPIIWLAGPHKRQRQLDFSSTATELETLAAALRELGTGALCMLHYALKGAVEPDRPDHERADLEARLLGAIEGAAARARAAVGPGRPRSEIDACCAYCIGRAYHDLTGDLPPTGDPYADRKKGEHQYHRLTRQIFALDGRLRSWQSQAKTAAAHVRAEMRKK